MRTIFNFGSMIWDLKSEILNPKSTFQNLKFNNMALKTLKRKYNMSDGDLLETAGKIGFAGDRDLADLATYGVVQATLDDIDAKSSAFANHPVDEYYAGLLMEAVADRDAKLLAMSEVAESIVRRGEIIWGKGDAAITKFGFEGYIKKKPADKVMICKTVHKVGTENLVALGAAGLTQTILDSLNTKIGDATSGIGQKIARVADRDGGTQTRITLGNALYEAVVKLADTGKSLWENTDESKYNDYVIYTSGQPLQVVTGTAVPQMVIQPSVVVDSPNDHIKVKNNGTKPLTVYFGDDPTDLPQTPSDTVAAGAETTFKAEDIGYTSAMNRFLLYNADATDSVAYEVRVS